MERVKKATLAADLKFAWEICPEEFTKSEENPSFLPLYLPLESYTPLGESLVNEFKRLGMDTKLSVERIQYTLGIILEPEIDASGGGDEIVQMQTFF